MQDRFIEYIRDRLPEFESQNALARKAGLTKGQISRLLLGQKKPSVDECNRLAKALNVEPDMLLRLAGRLPPKRDQLDPDAAELVMLFAQMSDEDKDEFLRMGRLKVEKQKRGKREKQKV